MHPAALTAIHEEPSDQGSQFAAGFGLCGGAVAPGRGRASHNSGLIRVALGSTDAQSADAETAGVRSRVGIRPAQSCNPSTLNQREPYHLLDKPRGQHPAAAIILNSSDGAGGAGQHISRTPTNDGSEPPGRPARENRPGEHS